MKLKRNSLVAQFLAVAFIVFLSSATYGQSITLSASPAAVTIFPGQQNVPVAVTVGGADTAVPLTVTMTGLPSGITVAPVTVTAGGSGTLYLNASVAAGQEGFSPTGAGLTSWTANPAIVAASGSTRVTTPLALTISISNPAFVPSTVNLPVVNINTNGAPIVDKTTNVPGTITITSADGQTPYLPNSDDSDNAATFHVHGNTTALMPKLPYHVKLNTSLDLLGTMGLNCPYVTSKGKPICDKSKSYILLANYDDKTFLRDWAASALANSIPIGNGYLSSPSNSPSPSGTSALMPWAPNSLFVELYVNGTYEGNYQLIEEIKVDSHRVNITELSESDVTDDITGGYLLEIDNRWGEDVMFSTAQGVPIGVVDPDFSPDPAVPQQTSYITNYVDNAEDALFASNFTDPALGWRGYFDEASAVNFYIVNDLMGNVDGGGPGNSLYLYKAIDNPFLYMGPVWDFDVSSGNVNYAPISNPTVPWMQTQSPWYTQWFKDPGFKADVTTQWNALKNNGVFTTWLASLHTQATALQQSQANNFGRWPMQGIQIWPNPEAAGSYDGEVQYLTTWLQLRMAYLDSVFNNKAATTTSLAIGSGDLRNGVPLTLTAQVAGASSPTGVVTFLSNGVALGSAALGAGGAAAFTTSALPVGTDSLIAVYNGDSNNALSASAAASLTVAAPLSATVVSVAGPATAAQGATTSLSAVVIPNSGTTVPTGNITFSIDNATGTTVPLNVDGTAAGTLVFPATGAHTVTAVYSGDANNSGSTGSTAITVTDTPSLTLSGTDVTIQAGAIEGNQASITVTPVRGFTGSVTLSAAITSSPAGASNLPILNFRSDNPLSILSGPENATLSITTFGPVRADARPSGRGIFGAGGLALAGVLLLGLGAKRRRWSALLGVSLLAILLAGLAGCQGGSAQKSANDEPVSPGTTPGAYVITVTATSGTVTAQSTINLEVKPAAN
jgi:CotH kinase protein/Bacterial Ig-like domain (group 3)